MIEIRPLCVFLCHASDDKAEVRKLFNQRYARRWAFPRYQMDAESLHARSCFR